MHMCDLHPGHIPFQSHMGPGLRAVAWRKEMALFPHVQPAVLSLLAAGLGAASSCPGDNMGQSQFQIATH